MSNRIEKHVELKAPIEKVWRALTDYREFGEWFRVDLDGPFVPGEWTTGRLTYPGYEGLAWEVEVVEMRKPDYFSFGWHPHAIDPDADYSNEELMLVEFRLETAGEGTRLTVIESGFEKLSKPRREEAIRSNTDGWEKQMANIKEHVES